jgi:hypothetical protein
VPKNRPEHVTIAGRVFELGAVYAPRNGFGRQRMLLAYEPDGKWLGGRVETWLIGRSGGRRDAVCGTRWARWAGERVVVVENTGRPSSRYGSGMKV